jgi:flagellar motility protein MotE (MotC chaperone)
MMAAVAGISAIANAMASAAPSPAEPEPTRLGTSIQQSMRERDQALAGQKRALDLREQAQRAAEQRLQTDLQATQGTNAGLGGGPATVYDELARIYQTMKPAKAAPIFERLELDVQLQVARRMRERSTALMLAAMSPDAAVELSMALAGRQVVKAPPKPVEAAPRPQQIGVRAGTVPPVDPARSRRSRPAAPATVATEQPPADPAVQG